jgi:hypothetical protein
MPALPDAFDEADDAGTVVPFSDADDAHEGAAIPAVHARPETAHVTFSPRTLDVLAELERLLREQGHGSLLRPFKPSDLVGIMAEMIAPRLMAKAKPDLGRIIRQLDGKPSKPSTRRKKR